jgi:hypothetical protein
MDRMDADGVTIVERNEEPAYVAFKCLDPTATGSRWPGNRRQFGVTRDRSK